MTETTYRLSTPVRMALLSDSHNRNMLPALHSLEKHHPQMIMIAGDFVFGDTPSNPNLLKMEESTNAMALLNGCSSIAPTFVSLGNHEWMLNSADLYLIRSTGAVLLDNEWTTMDGVIIGGLSSATKHQKDCEATTELYPSSMKRVKDAQPELSWLESMEHQEGYKILLSHHPEYYTRHLQNVAVDLILSGHAHGGQWRIGGKGIFAPGQGFFPQYTSGVHDRKLVISRGLSNTKAIPRLGNPTEIVYIE